MNSTTDKNQTPPPIPTNAKKKKSGGIFRTKLILITLTFLVLNFIYFHFFFEGHLRRLMEWGLTKSTYAEVNVGAVKFNLFKLEFGIYDFQMTNYEVPQNNLVAFSSVIMNVEMRALLMGKFVVEEASLLNLSFQQPRKRVGKIYPELKRKAEEEARANEGKESALSKTINQEKKKLIDEKINSNVLGDAMTFLAADNWKEGLSNVSDDLKTTQQIKRAEDFISSKKEDWKKSIAEIKQSEKLKSILEKMKGTKLSKDPKEALSQLKDLKKTYEEGKSELEGAKNKISSIQKDSEVLQKMVKDIDSFIKEDLESAKGKMKIPSLNIASVGKDLFARYISNQLAPYQGIIAKIQKYAPKKSKEEEIKPPPRGQGLNIHFPKEGGYPAFWIKKVGLSTNIQSDRASGEIKDISTQPAQVGRPISWNFQGELPSQKLSDVQFNGALDFRKSPTNLKFLMMVGRYPIEKMQLTESSKLSLGMEKLSARTKINGEFDGPVMDVILDSKFSDYEWKVSSEKQALQSILSSILGGIKTVDVNAHLQGPIFNPDISLTTGLADDLTNGIKNEFDKRLKEAEAQIKQLIENKIGEQKKKLLASLGENEKQIFGPLLSSNKSITDMSSSFDQVMKDLQDQKKNEGKEKAGKALQKGLDKLKNKLPFKF
ncbi:MAG: TIGR03545 family protein [Bacteriovoracaceae bacterium]|nr:TIGR03545 family protein [Bacteriovoracaceae bacterium]